MSRALWTPYQDETQRDSSPQWERPFLQLPMPMAPMPAEHAPVEDEGDEAPRVIIIDI